ncbi:MAG: phosphoribosylformylglycinamidine synthase subunit PurS [Calditerrivibrio sp.]|nr:phosphoribosylformylglycinamidine synthase subunit PurS [Calditerrivibrio sp.]MCA1932839.1 phosphoribosylformylglycinamidine synthase subunit PurS [Calditerrivibrio sp.]
MKAIVTVKLKSVVLDPQGQAVLGSLDKLGYDFVKDVRVGKVIELEFDKVRKYDEKVRELTEKLLVNPIIEEYEIKYIGDK